MLTDKELKKSFLKTVTKNSDKYFPTTILKREGYKRNQCKNCKKFFWSTNERTVCGDASC